MVNKKIVLGKKAKKFVQKVSLVYSSVGLAMYCLSYTVICIKSKKCIYQCNILTYYYLNNVLRKCHNHVPIAAFITVRLFLEIFLVKISFNFGRDLAIQSCKR